MDQSGESLHDYNNFVTRESNWVTEAEVRLLEFEHLEKDELSLQEQLKSAREFNKEVAAHEPRIIQVNEKAQKFILQAKVRYGTFCILICVRSFSDNAVLILWLGKVLPRLGTDFKVFVI